MYFHNFVYISYPLGKVHGPSFKQTWIPVTQGWLVRSLVEIGPVVLAKKMEMLKTYRQTDGQTVSNRKKLTWAFSLSELKINGIKKEKTKLQHSCLVCVKVVSINPNVIKTLPALCEASIPMFDWCTLEWPQHWQHIFLQKGSADLVWIMCDWSASFLWQHKMASETVQ